MLHRILYMVPGIGLPAQELKRRQEILNMFAGSGFGVDVKAVKDGPVSIESYCDEYLCVPDTLRLAEEAEKTGYEALILGCFGDPGIEALREVLRIPVVGPGESSLYVASMLGHGFSVITILESIVHPLKMLALKLGLERKLVSIRVIAKPVLSLAADVEGAKNALIKVSMRAVEEDKADTLVLGCMSEAFLGLAEEIQEELGVPVVNPVGVSVKMAELLIYAHLSHSKKAYATPPKKIPVA